MTEETSGPERGTAEENLLRTLYAEILKVDSVGPDDSFFALEGDSVAVLRLVGRAREAGLDIEIRDVFDAKTARGLATAARTARDRARTARQKPPEAPPRRASLSQAELDAIAAEIKG
ncbi:phosphopantetheine-binding protein [Streptomyces sp. NPDC014734]|uniref:phosphopantetheine-binding protein n=1 Tax=Streptomyces sp. NPDC014734 TaxID=3364886 RepID=UPI003701E182